MPSILGGAARVFAAFSLIATPVLAAAQAFPTKPVRLIVAYPPGGVADTLGRGIAQGIAKSWSQPMVVENRPGANSIIAAESVARSAPDGYTILLVDRAVSVINPLVYAKLPYDAARDLAPVVAFAQVANVFTINRDLPVQSLQDLIALAKAKPGQLNYGSLGVGSVPHLDTEAFTTRTGIKLTHVPYKGMTEIMPALMAGQIQVSFSPVPIARALLADGRIRALANGAPRRSTVLPDIPTFGELGFEGIESRTWFGLLVPAATPRAVVEKIAADVRSVVMDPAYAEKYLVPVGIESLGLGPGELSKLIDTERARYKVYVEALGIKLE